MSGLPNVLHFLHAMLDHAFFCYTGKRPSFIHHVLFFMSYEYQKCVDAFSYRVLLLPVRIKIKIKRKKRKKRKKSPKEAK